MCAYETYDLSGRLMTVVDVAGNTTTLTRDVNGRLLRVTDAGGRSILLTYDEDGRVTGVGVGEEILVSYSYNATGPHNDLESVRYPDGSGYDFIADGNGQVMRVSDASGRVVEAHAYGSYPLHAYGLTSELANGREKATLTYDTLRTTVTDANGNATTYHWAWIDGLRRVTKIVGPCPSCGGGEETREWTYDARGRVTAHQRSTQAPALYTYDDDDRITAAQDPLGRTTSYAYDAQGRLTSAAHPGGGLVTYTYGPHGPLTVTEKLSETTTRTTTYTYTPLGQIETVRDPRGKTTTYAYWPTGEIRSVADSLGHSTTFEYDSLGRRTKVTDALGHSTTTTYDRRGRPARVTNHDQTHTEFTYDLSGRRTAVQDPLGRTTRSVYDEYGRLEQVVDPQGGVTRYGYDLEGALTELTDAKGHTTTFGHDTTGRVTTVVYPGGGTESITYDAEGRLGTKTDRRGIVTTYGYDVLGRLTGKTYSNGDPAMSYTYDLAGRLQTAANGTDTLTWSYDLAGQLLSEQSARHGSIVSYTHDAAGNRVSLSLDGQLFLSYGYDDASRLTSLTRGSRVFGFGHDAANRRTSMTYPNGIATSYGYDEVNRLTSLGAVLNGTTQVTAFGYTYDAAGNRITKSTLDHTETYGYDALYRLAEVDRTGTSTGLWRFDYDAVGNRTTTQSGSAVTSATYNERNQLLSRAGGGSLRVRGTLDEAGSAKVNGEPARMVSGNTFEATIQVAPGTNAFTVEATDISGNVTSKTYEVEVASAGATYAYDSNGSLASKTEGSDSWTYEWNAEGQLKRVLKNGNQVARFAYDPKGRRVEKVAGGVTTSYLYDGEDILREVPGSATLKYIQAPGIDQPLAREDASGALIYYHADGLGSVVKRTSQAGAVVHEYRYDAWGNIEAGSTEPGYAFTGREWDPETGLNYYRARYYDPKIARFTSEDPIGFRGGTNLYQYALNSPAQNIDPSGLLVQVRCEKIGWHGTDQRTLAGLYRHCFVRTKCCGKKDTFDKTVEVGGTTQGQMPPLHINDFDGERGSEDVLTNPMLSEDCHLEKCILEKAEEVQATIAYDARHQNSNTFVHRLITACGIRGIVVGSPPTAW